MELKSRPLNKGETFACSFKRAKEVFKDTEICLNFACYGRDFGTFAYTPDRYYVKHNVKGRVVAAIYMHPSIKRELLNFYVIKASNYSEDQRKIFEEQILLELYNHYISLRDEERGLILKCHMMLVEITNGEFKIHKFVY